MEKYIAHRLSEGNKIFPTEIHIEENGISIKVPGLFSGTTQFFDYNLLSSVSITTPLMGYSSIEFYAADTRVFAHGFKKEEVIAIKSQIDKAKVLKQSQANTIRFVHSAEPTTSAKNISIGDELLKLKQLLDAGVLTQEEFNQQKSNLLNK